MSWNPFDWTANPFLALYATLAVRVLFWGLRLRSTIGPDGQGTHPLSVLDLAFLEGGAWRVGDVVLLHLLMGDGAVIAPDGRGITVIDQTPLTTLVEPSIRISVQPNMTRRQFQAAAEPFVARAQERLRGFGYSPSDHQTTSFRMAFFSVLAALLAFGVVRAFLGVSRHRPIGFLVLLMVVTTVDGIALMRRPHRTRAGDRATDYFRAAHRRAARAPLDPELPLAVAITGAAVLSGTLYESVYAASRRINDGGRGVYVFGDSGPGGDGGCGGGCGGCGGSN